MPPNHARGIILAAGASRRMSLEGQPRCKALLRLDGSTWLEHTYRALREGGCADIAIVIAEPHAAAIRTDAIRFEQADCVMNPHPETGMIHSLQWGLRHFDTGEQDEREKDTTSLVVIALVDHPRVLASTIDAMIVSARAHAEVDAIIPTFNDRKGHPYVLKSRAMARARAATTQTMRDVLHDSRVSLMPVDDPGVLDDFDTPKDCPQATQPSLLGSRGQP